MYSDVTNTHTHAHTLYWMCTHFIIIFDDAALSVNIIIAGRCSFLLLYRRRRRRGTGSLFFYFSEPRNRIFCFMRFLAYPLCSHDSRVYRIIYITYTFRYYIWPRAISVYDVIKTRDGCVRASESKSYYYIIFFGCSAEWNSLPK